MKNTLQSATSVAAASTQNFADAQFASDLKIQLYFGAGATAFGSSVANARLSIGASTGPSKNVAMSLHRSDASVTSAIVSNSQVTNNACVLLQSGGSGTDLLRAAVTASIATGQTLTPSVNGAVGDIIFALGLGGSDIEAAIVEQVTSTGTATYDVSHTLGGAPEIIIPLANGERTAANANFANGTMIQGAWTPNGQFGIVCKSLNNPATTTDNKGGAATANLGASLFNDGTVNHRLSISNVGATTFRLTLSTSGNANGVMEFLVIRGTSSPLSAEAGIFTAPTAAGPFLLNTQVPSVKTVTLLFPTAITSPLVSGEVLVSGSQAGHCGVGFVVKDGSTIKQGAISTNSKAGVTTSVAKTRISQTSCLLITDGDGNVVSEAAATAVAEDVALNFTTANPAALVGYLSFGVPVSGPTPVVATTVGTITNGSSFTITGTGFSASSNTVTLGGVNQPVTAESTTSITCTATLDTLMYGVSYPVTVTNAIGTVDVDPIQAPIGPASGIEYVTLIGPLVPPDQRLTSVPDLQPGWQLELSNITGGFTAADVQLYSDGEWIATNGNYTFDFRVNDTTGWGATATQTIGVAAPVINVDPVNQTLLVGQTALFSVSASGTITGYQWYKNDVAISGATSATYTTPALTALDDGAQFYVRVSNSTGFDQSATAVVQVVQDALPLRNDVWDGALPGLSINRTRAYVWRTAIQESLSGKESRVRLMQYPRVVFTLQYELLRDALNISELKAIVGLFNAAGGAWDTFLYKDPDFNRAILEKFGTGNGTDTDFQLIASYQNSGSVGSPELIQNLNGSPTIYQNNAVVSPSAYTINPLGVVKFTSARPLGADLRWTGDFYYRVRFSEDTLEMTQFMDTWWQSKTIILKSIKL